MVNLRQHCRWDIWFMWAVYESLCHVKPQLHWINDCKRDRMQGYKGIDHMMDIRKTPSGCGKWGENKANEPRKDEGTDQSKLGGMGMMGGWMEDGAHLGIGVKLTISFPLCACYKGRNAWQCFGDGKSTRSTMPILGLTYLV